VSLPNSPASLAYRSAADRIVDELSQRENDSQGLDQFRIEWKN